MCRPVRCLEDDAECLCHLDRGLSLELALSCHLYTHLDTTQTADELPSAQMTERGQSRVLLQGVRPCSFRH